MLGQHHLGLSDCQAGLKYPFLLQKHCPNMLLQSESKGSSFNFIPFDLPAYL